MKNSSLLASIIIPAFGRAVELDRAIRSVKACRGSDQVEIIVVDDCSPNPITSELLGPHDRVIRLEKNSGAAVARNVGIKQARGQLVYLLDNDDYIVERDFVSDNQKYVGTNALYYSRIDSQNYQSAFPSEVTEQTFFESIFYLYPHIAQTSSLFFDRDVEIRFDENLPKHQDWDLVLFSAVRNNIPVKQADGTIFFDRSDKNSLSRSYHGHKSEVWFEKVLAVYGREYVQKRELVNYYLFSQYLTHTPWLTFIRSSFSLLRVGHLPVSILLKKTAHRLLQVKQIIAG